jgi:hypothetical protein
LRIGGPTTTPPDLISGECDRACPWDLGRRGSPTTYRYSCISLFDAVLHGQLPYKIQSVALVPWVISNSPTASVPTGDQAGSSVDARK